MCVSSEPASSMNQFFFLTVKSMNDFLQFCYSKTRYQHLESFRPGWHHAPRENRWHAHDSKLESYHWLSECSDGWPAASSILAHCMVCQLESGRLVLGRFWMKAWMWKLESKSCGEKKIKKRAPLKGITLRWVSESHTENFYFSRLMTLQSVMSLGLGSVIGNVVQNEKTW